MTNEVIMFIVGIISVYLISLIKPEIVLKPLLSILKQKLSKNSNAISNALGLKLLESGIYAITYEEDGDPEVNKAMMQITANYEILKEKLGKKF